MSLKVPFVAHFRIIPNRGKRFETVRSLQRAARLIYGGHDGASGLLGVSAIAVALPGGGQVSGFNGHDMTDYTAGCAVKPQFGQTPAQLMIAGFYLVTDAKNDQPWADQTVTHAGEYFTGAGGANAARTVPTATTIAQMKALKTSLDQVINAELPGEGITVFRVDYSGIVWGDRGFHFPR